MLWRGPVRLISEPYVAKDMNVEIVLMIIMSTNVTRMAFPAKVISPTGLEYEKDALKLDEKVVNQSVCYCWKWSLLFSGHSLIKPAIETSR